MKSLKIGILASIAVHFLVLLILTYIVIDHVLIPEAVEIAFQAFPQSLQVTEVRPAQQPPSVIVTHKTVTLPQISKETPPPEKSAELILADSTVTDTVQKPTARDILTETLSFRLKKAMLEFPIPDSLLRQADSSKSICVLMPLHDAHQFGDPSAWSDRAAEEIYQRSFGAPQPVPLSDLLKAGAALLTKGLIGGEKTKKPKLTFIPTESELDVLDIVWEQEKATQLDIYADLDTSNTLSAEELDRVLEQMVAKRLLKRKQISPKDEIMVLTPLGSFAAEKNPLNMLNRVYLYEPTVKRDELLLFLNAVLYQVQSRSDITFTQVTDSTMLKKSLIYKIGKIVGEK